MAKLTPEERAAAADRQQKLEIMAGVFFAVRLFKSPPAGEDQRTTYAVDATLDAEALLRTLEAIAES